jgi:hypothetical protein
MIDKEQRLKEIMQEMILLKANLNQDEESNHMSADGLLCEALELFGQEELTSVFYDLEKWYA